MAGPVILNNRYQLEDRLGIGGMAMVYRAQDLMLERTVGIKLLRADFSKDPDFRERFRQEAKAAANLSHPNIVTVHDFGLDSGQLFIVMEYVPGTDLKKMIQQQSQFSMDEALDLIIQACAGIGYAHRAGLVHCDVKPQNMLVTPDHRLKVVDFGIARALASIMPDERAEVVWGSPQYFSPEQAAGNPPSPASDVYSLGVVLFEMLTGRLPFSASNPEELAALHRDTPPPSPRRSNPEIPAALEQVLLKVLSKEPSSRYRTADQLGRVLASFTQQAVAVPAIPSRPDIHPEEHYETRAMEQHVTETWAAPREPAPVQAYPAAVPTNLPPAFESQTNGPQPVNIDWLTWFLALLALIAVGGLIPFWLWVYYVLNPPL